MKKLNTKAFWLILSGIAGTLVYRAVDLFLSWGREYPALAERMDAERVERFATAIFRLNFIMTVALALICAYFIYRLIKNSKARQGQRYITFLFIINIIVVIFNVFALIIGNYTAIISIVINAVIIFGCSIQRGSEDGEELEES